MEARGVNGQVAFDGKTVTIRRDGAIARASFGKGEKRIPLSSITAIQWVPPKTLTRGFVAFTIPGGNEGLAAKGSRTVQAAKDENAVLVSRGQRAEFEQLVEAIDQAIAAR